MTDRAAGSSDVTAAEGLRCPHCGAVVEPEHRFCEECGENLVLHRSPVGGAVLARAEAACAVCGGDVDGDGFCVECGRAQPAGRDRMEYDLGLVAGVGDRGLRRRRNEDSFAFGVAGRLPEVRGVAAVVCDGVASSERADQASQAAADSAVDELLAALVAGTDPAEATRRAVAAAQDAVAELVDPAAPDNAPACTYVSAVVTGSVAVVGSVGDSRAYWVAGADSRQLTVDDTPAGQLVANGLLSQAEALAAENAHVLVRWLGADAGVVRPRVVEFAPAGPGVLLLCSDGLWNYLPEAAQVAAALPAGTPPLDAARELVRVALDAGGHDNVTVVLIPFPGPGPAEIGRPQP